MTPEVCLAMAIYFEARSEPLVGQVAVAQVVMNRVESRRFPDDVCSVVKQPYQFEFYWDGVDETVTDPSAWALARRVAGLVIDGRLVDVSCGATHYVHESVFRSWMRGMRITEWIGPHVFMRRGEPRCGIGTEGAERDRF